MNGLDNIVMAVMNRYESDRANRLKLMELVRRTDGYKAAVEQFENTPPASERVIGMLIEDAIHEAMHGLKQQA